MTTEDLNKLNQFQARINALEVHKSFLEAYYQSIPFELQISIKIVGTQVNNYLHGYYPPDLNKCPYDSSDCDFILNQIQIRIDSLKKEFDEMFINPQIN